jgi:hypothetical protein
MLWMRISVPLGLAAAAAVSQNVIPADRSRVVDYITLFGVNQIEARHDSGAPMLDVWEGEENVASKVVLEPGMPARIWFRTADSHATVEIIRGIGRQDNPVMFARYALDPSSRCELRLTAFGKYELRCGSNGMVHLIAPVKFQDNSSTVRLQGPKLRIQNKAASIEIKAVDPSGVQAIQYSTERDRWLVYHEPFTVDPAVVTVYARAFDRLNNQSDTYTLRVRDVPPDVQFNFGGDMTLIRMQFPGLRPAPTAYFSDDGVHYEEYDESHSQAIRHEAKKLFTYSVDSAGNRGRVWTIDVKLPRGGPTDLIYERVPFAPSGKVAAFSATLLERRTGITVPNAVVNFSFDGVTTITRTNSKGIARVNYTPHHAGFVNLTITFAGDATHDPALTHALVPISE